MNVKSVSSFNLIDKMWVKILIVLVIACVLVISISKISAMKKVKKNAPFEEFTAHLDQRITALMKEYGIPGVNIALIEKGQTTWTKAYGYADITAGRKMTTDTYCRVESISKSVTTWGIMKLVQEGKLDLDKPVQDYLKNWEMPQSKFAVEKVTVRQILTHTAGMPLGDIFERFSPEEKIPSLKQSLSKHAVLMQEPGQSFFYSNTGYDLLELVIEEITGRDYATYMQDEVLEPVGMHQSSFNWSEDLQPAVPVGYDLEGNPVSVYVYPEKASGGLFSTVGDIATFVAAGMSNFAHTGSEVLTNESIKQMYTPMVKKIGAYSAVFDAYGFGHYMEILPNGQQAISHGGQGGGCMTHFHAVPETGDGIVILTNSQRSWPFIAYILSDWAQWRGFGAVGMGKLIWAQRALWALIGLIFVLALWQVWKFGRGLIMGTRHFAPLAQESRFLRTVETVVSLGLLSVIVWCLNQDYLFISSVFPIAYSWLGLAIIILALVLLLYALFPLAAVL